MTNTIESETIIERHQIARFGNPIAFARVSQKHGIHSLQDHELIATLEAIAKLDDNDGRVLCLEMLSLVKRLKGDCDELRMRFKTIGNALDAINDSMKPNESA